MAKEKENLKKAILGLDEAGAVKAAEAVVKAGEDAVEAIEAMAEAMQELGKKFESQEIFLPELMIAADGMKGALQILEPEISKASKPFERKGTVVIGTVKGDVHSLGKDIVGTLLTTVGFDVIDLGVDVAPTQFIKEAQAKGAVIIAASALMSTTLPGQKDLIEFLKAGGVRDKFKVMVGGGVASQVWADQIGADGYGLNAEKAMDVALELAG